MSEIDKLINQAFPDELRDIEPIDVDEDAILSMTLENLGLKPSPKIELPELTVRPPRRRHTGGQRKKEEEPEFVEVPVVVHHLDGLGGLGHCGVPCAGLRRELGALAHKQPGLRPGAQKHRRGVLSGRRGEHGARHHRRRRQL